VPQSADLSPTRQRFSDIGPAAQIGIRNMAKVSPSEFVRDVRSEVARVTWPTRKETTVTTAMVFVMVVLAAMFFLVVDQSLAFAVKLILGLGS
jgi:preprotein translocase subunit SecE